MTDKIVDTLENLIELNEAQAPLEDIDVAVIEARRVLDDFFKDSGTAESELYEWLETCPTHEWEVNHSQDDGCMVIFRWPVEQETS